MKTTEYERRYKENEQYWGREISKMALKALDLYPIKTTKLKILDIGCGEGANAIFFASNGHNVSAFDLSNEAIKKTNLSAEQFGVPISTFIADINEYELDSSYDIIFSSGTLQYLLPEKRKKFIEMIKKNTKANGINVLHTFVSKPFIPIAPDAEISEVSWESGELLKFYSDWRVESFIEEIKTCNSSGIQHEHAHNRIWARRIEK